MKKWIYLLRISVPHDAPLRINYCRNILIRLVNQLSVWVEIIKITSERLHGRQIISYQSLSGSGADFGANNFNIQKKLKTILFFHFHETKALQKMQDLYFKRKLLQMRF